ncbi:MAG TPA: preprotein translocase subunit SecE [Fimbriimonadaceae bacterium]|nr:preprotein translocase subunit SecE [Fimbriimonadaceae bacterium]
MSRSKPPSGSVPMPKMRRGPKGFYRDIIREMKHVNWPTPQETTRLSGVVLAVCIFIVLLLMGSALVMGEIVNAIVGSH